MILLAAAVTSWDLLGVAVAAGVFVVALLLIAFGARRARRCVGSAPPPPGEGMAAPGRPPASFPLGGARLPGLSRRQLVERGAIGLLAASLSGVLASAVDYVVGALGHPGRRYRVGTAASLQARAGSKQTPYDDAVGGFYVVAYPAADLPEARRHYGGEVLAGMEGGFVALDQACTHLGCRVPWCPSSQWFECPCHGSRYNGVGEQRRGPAPRGLDRYAVTIEDGEIVVDTRRRLLGPPPGTDTTDQARAGPHCY
jgi:cytochrome b6-f complex iron-sulfur subunit